IIAKVLSRYIIIIVSVSYANKLISFSLKEQVKLLNKIMALAIPMVLILLFINSLSIDNSIIHLLIMIFSGILVYISTSYFIKADAFYLLLELLNIRKFAAKTAK